MAKAPGHIVSSSDRFWLRFTRTLPNAEVGSEIPRSVMTKAMTKRLIGMNVGMCISGALLYHFYIVYFSKKRQSELNLKRGDRDEQIKELFGNKKKEE